MDPDTTTATTTTATTTTASGIGTATDRVLDLAWRRQRQWSIAASAARARLDRSRLVNLGLLVLGALAGATAAQTWLAPSAATGFAIGAAVVLAIAGLVQANALTPAHTARWTNARAAAEALKAEIYRYLIRVAPYADADRAKGLQTRLAELDERASRSATVTQQTTPADNRELPAVRTFAEYVTGRAQDQVNWHLKSSVKHDAQARRLRRWQLAATAVGVALSAVAGIVPALRLSTWTAAATTIAAAFGTHLAATQHQRIAAAYAATARQLEYLIVGIDPATATAEQQALFVAEVERILLAQNDGWTDLLSEHKSR